MENAPNIRKAKVHSGLLQQSAVWIVFHRTDFGGDVIVRLFNTVGPRQTGQYGMVVPRFVTQALLGEPILVYGDGSQSRCFCHVKDAVWAMMRLMDTPKAYGEVYNVGNDCEISIRELAELVRAFRC